LPLKSERGVFQNDKLGLPNSPAMVVVISAKTGLDWLRLFYRTMPIWPTSEPEPRVRWLPSIWRPRR
jgi:hypothetical protein